MHVIKAVNGSLQRISAAEAKLSKPSRALSTGLPELDALPPGGAFASGAIHEVLSPLPIPSVILPILLARPASRFGRVAWCDGLNDLYPPAVASMGLPLDRLMVIHPSTPADQLRAVAECLRCRGVAMCVAPVERMSRLHARRLQLAAERGGGMGILLRPARAVSWPYAAVTRWMVSPVAGERMIQRWSVELIHGHGGRVGQSVLLEWHRETHHVRSIDVLAGGSDQAQVVPASA